VRLHDDHKHAQLLAQRLSKIPGIVIDEKNVETNIITFDVNQLHQSPDNLLDALKHEGVLLSRFTPTTFRAVTHLGISHQDILDAIEVIDNTLLQ
jgi:threonine aldolase